MQHIPSRLFIAAILFALLLAITLATFPISTRAASRTNPTSDLPAPAWYGCTVVVQPGDNLFRIALRYGISYYALAAANGIYNPNFIYVGMVLQVPCAYPPPVSYPPTSNCGYYIVRPGDTLFRLALHYGVSWQTLTILNHLYNANLIYVGMVLRVPCSAPPPPPPTKTATPTLSAPFASATGSPTPFTREVKLQNNLYNPSFAAGLPPQTINWKNYDSVQHTVTQGTCSGTVCTPTVGGFDSGLLNPGATFTHTFTADGIYPYFCKVHGAAMRGTVNLGF